MLAEQRMNNIPHLERGKVPSKAGVLCTYCCLLIHPDSGARLEPSGGLLTNSLHFYFKVCLQATHPPDPWMGQATEQTSTFPLVHQDLSLSVCLFVFNFDSFPRSCLILDSFLETSTALTYRRNQTPFPGMCALVPPELSSAQRRLFLTCKPRASLSSTGFTSLYLCPLSPRTPDSRCIYLLTFPCSDETLSILGEKNTPHCYYSITTTTLFYHIIHIFVPPFKTPPSISKNPTSEIIWLKWQNPLYEAGSANCWWRCGATRCLGMENGIISPENRLAVL